MWGLKMLQKSNKYYVTIPNLTQSMSPTDCAAKHNANNPISIIKWRSIFSLNTHVLYPKGIDILVELYIEM